MKETEVNQVTKWVSNLSRNKINKLTLQLIINGVISEDIGIPDWLSDSTTPYCKYSGEPLI